VWNFTSRVTYTLTAAGGFQTTYTVIVKNSNAKITGFSFTNPPATGFFETAKSINAVVPSNTGYYRYDSHNFGFPGGCGQSRFGNGM
jgi:hypothetical protein